MPVVLFPVMKLMNRVMQLAALAVCVLVPHAARAQRAKPVTLGISGGMALPLGDLGTQSSIGYEVTGYLFFNPRRSKQLSYRGDISYDKWNNKKKGTAAEATTSALSFAASAIWTGGDARSSMRPYAFAGGGMYKLTRTYAGNLSGIISENSYVGAQAGGGLEFGLSGFSTFLEARFVNVFSSGSSTTFAPITFGIHM